MNRFGVHCDLHFRYTPVYYSLTTCVQMNAQRTLKTILERQRKRKYFQMQIPKHLKELDKWYVVLYMCVCLAGCVYECDEHNACGGCARAFCICMCVACCVYVCVASCACVWHLYVCVACCVYVCVASCVSESAMNVMHAYQIYEN